MGEKRLASEWFKKLPPVAEVKAKRNMKTDEMFESLSEAIKKSFRWDRTPEDKMYWYAYWKNAIYSEARQKEKEEFKQTLMLYTAVFIILAIAIYFGIYHGKG